MNIKSISSSNQTNTSFKGTISLRLGMIPESFRPKIIESVRNKIGEGLVSKHVGFRQKQDIFVGFNYMNTEHHLDMNEIVTSTGDDVALIWDKGAKYTNAKYNKIDMKILRQLKKILEQCGIPEVKGMIDFKNGHTGAFKKISPDVIETKAGYPWDYIKTTNTYAKDDKGLFVHTNTKHSLNNI